MGGGLITIERHIIDQQKLHPGARGIFSNLLYDIALAAKIIARETMRAGLADILGRAGTVNVHGEHQQKLDVFAQETMVAINNHTGRLAVMASEEADGIIPIPREYGCGPYVLIFDPLDGSSNIAVNVSIGTIFAVYRKVSPGECGAEEDCLQPGSDLAAAGYVIYGSSTMLVYTAGHGVHGFTLDPSLGEFLLSHPDIRIPEEPRYYSVNQGYESRWSEGVRRYVKWLQGMDADEPRKPLSARYIGSLVADFHRNLLEGGIFLYPSDAKNPNGKIRLTYEAIPMAYIAEQAGGYASDGRRPILDIRPEALHQRTPLFIGNRDLVEKAEEFIRRYDS